MTQADPGPGQDGATRPVEVGPLVPGRHARQVRIERPGTTPVVVACADRARFADVLRRERPDLSPDDPAAVHFADHPGEWPSD